MVGFMAVIFAVLMVISLDGFGRICNSTLSDSVPGSG